MPLPESLSSLDTLTLSPRITVSSTPCFARYASLAAVTTSTGRSSLRTCFFPAFAAMSDAFCTAARNSGHDLARTSDGSMFVMKLVLTFAPLAYTTEHPHAR